MNKSIQYLQHFCHVHSIRGRRPVRGEMRRAWRSLLDVAEENNMLGKYYLHGSVWEDVKGPVSVIEVVHFAKLVYSLGDIFKANGVPIQSINLILPPYYSNGGK